MFRDMFEFNPHDLRRQYLLEPSAELRPQVEMAKPLQWVGSPYLLRFAVNVTVSPSCDA